MPEFTDPAKLAKHIEKAMGELRKEVVVTSQARLGSSDVSPIQSGRLRSSWFAAEGTASNAVASEGSNSANKDAQGLTADAKTEYHLTNNLPYAEAVAIEGKVVNKGANWFVDFVNSETPKIAEKAGQVIKQRYDL